MKRHRDLEPVPFRRNRLNDQNWLQQKNQEHDVFPFKRIMLYGPRHRNRWTARLHPSLKRLLGTILLIALVTVYPFLVLLFAVALMPRLGGVGQFFFYAVAGLLWVPPAGLIILWMHGGRKKR